MSELQIPDSLTELATEVATKARDAAYTVVGLGVLGFQRLQVERQERARRAAIAAQRAARIRQAVATGAGQVDEWLDVTVQFLESSLQPLEEQLPEPARELADKARAGVQTLRTQLRDLVTSGS